MEQIITFFNQATHLSPGELTAMLWAMLPGAVLGAGLAVGVLFIRETLCAWLKHHQETTAGVSTWARYTQHVAESVSGWFVWVGGVYVAIQVMPYMDAVDGAARRVFMLALFVQLGLMVMHVLRAWNTHYSRAHRATEPARVTMMGSMVRVGYIFVWLVVFILLLNTYGVDVTALVAGLGVGGIAVAFALQNVLKDIFSSFSIVFDKPFVIGDFIIAGDYMGVVEDIGIKTTRIRALSGEQIVMNNSDLLESRIRNYRTLGERRVVLGFRVDFDTSEAKLAQIPDMVKEILQKNDDVRVDRVHLQSVTDFGPHYEVVYYVGVPDFNRMMDINHALYVALFGVFGKEGITFAIPVQKNVGEVAPHQGRREARPANPSSKAAAKAAAKAPAKAPVKADKPARVRAQKAVAARKTGQKPAAKAAKRARR